MKTVTEYTVEWTDEHGDIQDESAFNTETEALQALGDGTDYAGRTGRVYKDVIRGLNPDGTGSPMDWELVSREKLPK